MSRRPGVRPCVAAGAAGVPPMLYGAASVGWELAEDPLKRALPGAFPEASKDSKTNALGDILIGLLGFGLGSTMRRGKR